MEYLSDARSTRPVIALAMSAALAVAACGGSALSPAATASPAASATSLDPCLVGTWTVVGQTQNSPADDEQITFRGGAGEVFTIDAQGGVTIDTHAAQPLVLTSAGETFKGTVTGTGRGSLSTLPAGPNRIFFFTPSADDTRKTLSVDSTGTPLGPARPDTAFSAIYTCAPGRFTFYKSAVNYMVDGPIVELVAGSGRASNTASPVPS